MSGWLPRQKKIHADPDISDAVVRFQTLKWAILCKSFNDYVLSATYPMSQEEP